MNHVNHGLLYRVKRAARQIAEQHAHIDEIFRGLEPAISSGAVEETRDLFIRYRGAIDAHFSLEEGVFFPAVRGLHPEHASDLEALSFEHTAFLEQLEQLGRHLEDDLAGFGRGLQAIAGELGVHESREERLVRRLASQAPETD